LANLRLVLHPPAAVRSSCSAPTCSARPQLHGLPHHRAFIPHAFPNLANLAQRLIFIGFDNVFFSIDYFSTSFSTVSLTSSLHTPSMMLPLWLRGGVSPLVRLRLLSSLTIRDAIVVHVTTATTAR
jgi:hypothetical protein